MNLWLPRKAFQCLIIFTSFQFLKPLCVPTNSIRKFLHFFKYNSLLKLGFPLLYFDSYIVMSFHFLNRWRDFQLLINLNGNDHFKNWLYWIIQIFKYLVLLSKYHIIIEIVLFLSLWLYDDWLKNIKVFINKNQINLQFLFNPPFYTFFIFKLTS